MTNSNNLTDRYSRRFRTLALLTMVTVYLLILAGGIVRGTGSGMGCPDWPTCFGRWVPPTEVSQLPANYQKIYGAKLKREIEFNAVKTWIEYVNRLLGALSGFLVLATFVVSFPYLRRDPLVFWGSLAALLLIGANGWLGSRVVATELAQYMITLHLMLAILVVFTRIFVLVRSGAISIGQRGRADWYNRTANRLLIVTIALSIGQVILGTQVREALNEAIQQLGYTQRVSWISSLDWRFYVHRSFSLVISALHSAFVYQVYKSVKIRLIVQLTVGTIVLVGGEIMTGAIMGYFSVPAAAQPIHLFLAVLLVGLQFTLWLLMHPTLNSLKRVAAVARLQEV